MDENDFLAERLKGVMTDKIKSIGTTFGKTAQVKYEGFCTAVRQNVQDFIVKILKLKPGGDGILNPAIIPWMSPSGL